MTGSQLPKSEPMPVFAIKARDNLAAQTVLTYYRLCREHGLNEQAAQVRLAYDEIVRWRLGHPDECKWPDHAHVAAGQPGSGSEATASSTQQNGGDDA